MKNYLSIYVILIISIDPIFCDINIKGISPLNSRIDRKEIYEKSWAIIIGINQYKYVKDLQYAKKDAQDFKDLLVNKFDFDQDNIFLLLDKNATLKNINHILSKVALKTTPNDRLVIFFSGHGETINTSNGGELGYLIPTEGEKENLFATGISMRAIKDLTSIAKAKHILFLIDACYSGLMTVGTKSPKNRAEIAYLQKIITAKSRHIITAGSKGEEVIEKSEWGNSAFTKNLIYGLKNGFADLDNDGIIFSEELGLFLQKQVSIDTENFQTPQQGSLTNDLGEFAFLTKISIQIESELNRNISANTNNHYNSYSHEVKTQRDQINIEMMDKIDSIKRQNTLLMIGIGILAVAVFL